MNRPLRILHVIEALGTGGAERLLFTNLKHLDHAAVESEVVKFFEGPNFWRGPIEELGVKVTDLGATKYSDIPRAIFLLRRHLAANRPDLIHTHLFAANVVGRVAGRLLGIPVVSSIHNPEYESEALQSVGRSGQVKITAARFVDSLTAFAGCTKMVGVSEFVRESIARKLLYPADKIEIIHNPVSSINQKPSSDRKTLLEKLGLPADARVLLNVGRVGPQKGILAAIRAMPLVVEHEPRAFFLSVGAQTDPVYAEKVANKIAELGVGERVRLLGERSDIADLLSACDVFVFPSLFEGLGIALAEAMAAGCACVVSRIRPFDEFLTDGENAVIVPPNDADALAEAILDLLSDEDKRTRLGAAARQTAVSMFSPAPAARKLEALYTATAKS